MMIFIFMNAFLCVRLYIYAVHTDQLLRDQFVLKLLLFYFCVKWVENCLEQPTVTSTPTHAIRRGNKKTYW